MTTTMITTTSGGSGITFMPTPATQQLQQQQFVGTPFVPGVQVAPTVRSNHVESYLSRQSMGLGITLIVVGLLAIIFNGVGFAVSDSLAVVSHGFYCGTMFIITGSFGVGAATSKNKCVIITFMVLAIISAVLTLNLFIVGIVGAATNQCYYSGYGYDSCDYYSGTGCGYSYSYTPPCGHAAVAMEALQACLALVAAIASIWGSAICCKAVCCCRHTVYGGAVLSANYASHPVVIVEQRQQVVPPQIGNQQVFTAAGAPLTYYPGAQYWMATPYQPQGQNSATSAAALDSIMPTLTTGNIPPPAYSTAAASAPSDMSFDKF